MPPCISPTSLVSSWLSLSQSIGQRPLNSGFGCDRYISSVLLPLSPPPVSLLERKSLPHGCCVCHQIAGMMFMLQHSLMTSVKTSQRWLWAVLRNHIAHSKSIPRSLDKPLLKAVRWQYLEMLSSLA